MMPLLTTHVDDGYILGLGRRGLGANLVGERVAVNIGVEWSKGHGQLGTEMLEALLAVSV